jgi:crossover junction endodeoxyribonuclease RuvC
LIILGIDPGSLITGYGFIRVDGSRLVHVDSGALMLKKHGEIPNRLAFLEESLDPLIERFRPQAVSVERVFHSINFQSALKLGYVRGVVMLLAARRAIPVAEYAPTEVKNAVTGYGRADKSQVQEMVRMLLGLAKVPSPADISDALALAICHAHAAPVRHRYGIET